VNFSGWTNHLVRLVAGTALTVLIAWWFGQLILVPAMVLLFYLAWHLYNLMRLYQWSGSPDNTPPESPGVWGEIFKRLSALENQAKDKNRQNHEIIDDFEALVDVIPDAILVIDNQGSILRFNRSAVRILGLNTLAAHGQPITEKISDPVFANWLSTADNQQTKLNISSPSDENINLQIGIWPIRNNQRLLILRDTTELINLNRMRHDLVANVSHELRTPLTVLLGYLEVLKTRQGKANPKVIKRMFNQARQMHALVEDLLELSRIQDASKQSGVVEIDVSAMLSSLAEQAEDLSQGNHQFSFDVEPGLNLHGEQADLESAFQNIIVNAINYTPEQGTINVVWKETSDCLLFSVKDNGVGIPEQDIPRIVERFYRVGDDRNRETGGTGLGLAIVKHVLNSHGATLEVHSEPGKGSEFRCKFPLERRA